MVSINFEKLYMRAIKKYCNSATDCPLKELKGRIVQGLERDVVQINGVNKPSKVFTCSFPEDLPAITESEYDRLLLELHSKKMRHIGPLGDVLGDYYQSLLYLAEDGVQVPQKMKALKMYIGNGSQDTRSHCSELYLDINYFLRNYKGSYIPKLEKGTNAYRTIGLINFDSETAKDIVRCLDYSLKEVDKEFGVYKGFVYRNGKMSSNSGTYVSTSTDLHCTTGDTSEFHVIKTKRGHDIHKFQQKYYPVNESENEILLPRDAQYREVTGLQYEEERIKLAKAKYEYLKPGHANITFEDVLSRTHVWEEI